MTFYITPFGRLARQRMLDRWAASPSWAGLETDVLVPVDVEAKSDEFILTALLPGVKPDDLNIQIVNETVSIQGELRGPESKDEKASYLLQEIPTGRFSRVLTLPSPLDSAHVDASMDNGILTLRVPKAENARPKSIKVESRKSSEAPRVKSG